MGDGGRVIPGWQVCGRPVLSLTGGVPVDGRAPGASFVGKPCDAEIQRAPCRYLDEMTRGWFSWLRDMGARARAAELDLLPRRRQIEIDPRVPTVDAWDPRGLVGIIGKGPHRGERIFAEREVDRRGNYQSYCLELPAECLRDADGRALAYYGNWDLRVPGLEAGMIDDLTQALDVEWSTKSSDVDAYLATAYLPDDGD